MPSRSKAQKKTMDAIAHGWRPPKGSSVAKIPVSVAKDFVAADKRTHNHPRKSKGGSVLSMAAQIVDPD